MCVCLFVCLLFIGHTTFVHFAALPPSPRAGAVVASGPARAGKHAQREHARACRTTSQRKKSYADAFQKRASQAVVQFAPLLIIDVLLNQVTSVVLISLYFIHFMTIYIVIRPLIQSHFKQNYWQEETSYLIFDRSRPWSASDVINIQNCV